MTERSSVYVTMPALKVRQWMRRSRLGAIASSAFDIAGQRQSSKDDNPDPKAVQGFLLLRPARQVRNFL
jgi:hypothetical protein